MADTNNITAWILLILSIYAIAASIGELTKPGSWARMIWELDQSPALRFLTGIFVLVLGAAVYLVNPYDSSDWASILVTVMGGLMMLEGIAFLAFPDWMMKLCRALMGQSSKLYALFSLALGIAFLFVSYVSFLAS